MTINMIFSGQVLEVVLAKPQSDRKFDGGANPYNSGPHPNYAPYPPYGGGFPGNPYGPVGAPYGGATGYQQVFLVYRFCSHFVIPPHGLATLSQ